MRRQASEGDLWQHLGDEIHEQSQALQAQQKQVDGPSSEPLRRASVCDISTTKTAL